MMKFELTEMASVSEVIGAVAIVISLFYVGMQVNDSAGAVRSAAANDADVAIQNWYLQIGSNQQTSELFYQALTSEDALSNEEEFQFLMMTHGLFLGFQNSYLLAEHGFIDAELRESLTKWLSGGKDLPGMKRYWRQRRTYLHAGFADWVDEIFSQNTETTVDIYRMSAPEPGHE
jgi:hypothetical protein